MNRRALLTAALILATAAGAMAADAKPQEAAILQQWQGPYPVKQVNLLPAGQQGTPTGFINEAKTFAAVWKAWKGGEKAPAVDFQKNLVVFSRNTEFLNVTRIFKVLLKDGVAEILAMETMSAIPIEDKVHMAMAVIAREGVKSVKCGEAVVTVPPPEAAKEPPKAAATPSA